MQPLRCSSCEGVQWLCRDLTGKPNSRKKEALRYFSIESAGALVVSLFINVFIMAVFAKGFFGKDIPDIGLANAGRYLGDTFGTPVVNKRPCPEIHGLITSFQVPSMIISGHQTCRNTTFAWTCCTCIMRLKARLQLLVTPVPLFQKGCSYSVQVFTNHQTPFSHESPALPPRIASNISSGGQAAERGGDRGIGGVADVHMGAWAVGGGAEFHHDRHLHRPVRHAGLP